MTAEFPVLPFRTTLYTPEELFSGFRGDDPSSYASTLDLRTYASTRSAPSREVGMLRALHDQCITDARDELLVDRRVVAVMGGHALARDDAAYRDVVELAAALTARGDLVVSGGGPGAMEATHLGALLAPADPAARSAAIDHLATVPRFPGDEAPLVGPDGAVDPKVLAALHAWQRPAFEVLDTVAPEHRGRSLAVPTWFYGHEPPTPFATDIAKYFSNSLREDGLLAIAGDGIVFAPGWAGTVQEVFQDAAQNFYRVFHDRFSPMAFLDTGAAWSEQLPVLPLLRTLFGEADFERYVCCTDQQAEVLSFLAAAGPSAR
ncbi:hypothetical protein KSP35_12355 [Aquihabitans sp. G128]|uniref:LOG family protein n=1 Tax=Aquihabitans sp. G128 TaxID=2849779 RepID=UPI001C242286|nr:hypothetical protein [Aquihabitans sp. G128]QXC59203.1 hypothetical protein KSP35_12355 [Aquihabitans sp. G128]